MAIVFDSDAGTITGLSVGGLPDGIVDAGTLATNSVDSAELIDGAVDDSHMAAMAASKLTGALPAISAASLTNIPAANITGTLPAISGASLTGITTGKVLQIVHTIGHTGSTTTSSSQAVVGDAGTITPSSTSSKILVTIGGVVRFGDHNCGQIAIWRSIASGSYAHRETFSRHTCYQAHSTSDAQQGQVVTMTYLDSPNTTSAVNYKAAMNCWGGLTSYWLPNPSNGDATTITMMEIAG